VPRADNVRFGSKGEMCAAKGHVCFNPESGRLRCARPYLLWTKSGHQCGSSSSGKLFMPLGTAVLTPVK
jgi:hypothetical protein